MRRGFCLDVNWWTGGELQWWLNFLLSAHSGAQPDWPSRLLITSLNTFYLRLLSMVVQPGQRRSQLWDERSFQTSFLHDGDQYAHGNLRCSRNISFVPLCDPVCECLGQIFRPHELVFTMISSVSYTVFQNHVASIELAQVKSKSSNICERKKKKTSMLCFLSYYLCHMHIFQ